MTEAERVHWEAGAAEERLHVIAYFEGKAAALNGRLGAKLSTAERETLARILGQAADDLAAGLHVSAPDHVRGDEARHRG